MHKLVILIRRSPQAGALEQRWSDGFVPLAERLPGLRRVVVTRPVGAPASAPRFQLIHELFFDDLDSLQAAMISPDGQAAGRALMGFAAAEAELFFAEHLEMDVERRPGDVGEAV